MSETPAETGHVPATPEQTQTHAENTDAHTQTDALGGMGAAFEKAKSDLADRERRKAELNGAQQPAETPAGEQTTEADTKAAEETKQPPLKPHDRWTKEDKEAFATLPRELQQTWLNQYKNWESGFNKKFEETAQSRNFQEQVTAAIPEAYRTYMQQKNIAPHQAIGRLFEIHQFSEQNPVEFVANFMKTKGLDPKTFLQSEGGTDAKPQQTETVQQQLAPILQPLLAEINKLKQGQTVWQQQELARQDKANEETLTRFMEEKDASGTSLYPYVERVADRMAELIEADPRYANMDARQRLEEAYQIAVLSNPEIRDEIFSSEASKRAEALEKERLNNRLGSAATAKPSASSSAPIQKPAGIRAAFDAAKKQVGSGII